MHTKHSFHIIHTTNAHTLSHTHSFTPSHPHAHTHTHSHTCTLQALLSNKASLAAALSLDYSSNIITTSTLPNSSSALIVDVVSLLSVCCHDEWALSNFYKKLRTTLERFSRDQGRWEVCHTYTLLCGRARKLRKQDKSCHMCVCVCVLTRSCQLFCFEWAV